MSRALVDLAEGMVASAGDRLAPDGLDIPRHFLLVARRLAEAETALAKLDDAPDPFSNVDTRVRVSGASFAVMEAATAYWVLAVRLRSRFTGAHARRASEPLRTGLRNLAADAGGHASGAELLGNAARALAFVSGAVEAAEHEQHARRFGITFDQAIQQFVAVGILSLLRVALALQEDNELR